MNFIDYIDLGWLTLIPVLVKPRLWLKTALFIITCVLVLRFQIELMEVIGFANGFVDLIDMPLLQRGMITYGVFIAGFLILTHFSQDSDAYVFIAAGITVFFMAFIVSTIVLML